MKHHDAPDNQNDSEHFPAGQLFLKENGAEHRNLHYSDGLRDGPAFHLHAFSVSDHAKQHACEHQCISDDDLPVQIFFYDVLMLFICAHLQKHLGEGCDR